MLPGLFLSASVHLLAMSAVGCCRLCHRVATELFEPSPTDDLHLLMLMKDLRRTFGM